MSLVISSLAGITTLQSADAKQQVEQYDLPIPKSYRDYDLRVEASTRRPEAGKPVVFKATISPEINPNKVEYQFLINGAPIHEAGMHKVHTFKETGTYKISAFAKIDGSYLLNSPPIIIHVIDAWVKPEAVINPVTITVPPGKDATFTSKSVTDTQSRQWLYWSMSNGHRGIGEQFMIKTNSLQPGQYPIELVVKDDRKRQSTAQAYLVITNENIKTDNAEDPDNLVNNNSEPDSGINNEIETFSLDKLGNLQNDSATNGDENLDLYLHSTHKNRLEKMQVIFWIQNAQPGANTKLQLDFGDSNITPWGKNLRYGHRYQSFGVYTAMITARTPDYIFRSNKVTVYIWPLWLPIAMMILGLFLAGIPFFKRHQQQQKQLDPIRYQHYPDHGQHQLILSSDEETPAITIEKNHDNGKQSLTTRLKIPQTTTDLLIESLKTIQVETEAKSNNEK